MSTTKPYTESMISFKLKLILVSERELLAEAVRSLLHLGVGEESILVAFEDFPSAIAQKNLESFDLFLLEADSEVEARLHRLGEVFAHGSVVVLTEKADHELGLACIRAGAHDYLNLEEISPSSLFRSLRFAIERKKVQQALQSSQAQLSQAQKMEAIGRMASGLAHDFRQYIQVIVGNSKVLQRLLTHDENVTQLITDIAQAGYDANNLVGQVLDFAREDPVETSSLDLNTVLLDNEAMMKSFGKNVRLDIEQSQAPLMIDGNRIHIGQILLNLAINAVDACQEEQDTVNISVRALHLNERYADRAISLEPGRYAVLKVQDSGSGISEENLEKLYDPFFTTKPRGQGTGLGLSTVYSLARGMGGQVGCWTKLGVGTTFSVFLNQLSEQRLPPVPRLNRTVGLISGEPLERHNLRQNLKQLGCHVTEFFSLVKGKEWAERNQTCLLVDLDQVPRLQDLDSNCILLSGVLVAQKSMPFQLLKRPFSLTELSGVINSVIQNLGWEPSHA